ncbi:MAG: 50S ribosome-binding GTPase [Gammaproteobacteria bacterium]|nr:50S ribosome-binding GTPase [Gammaproteobacteria bacterium]
MSLPRSIRILVAMAVLVLGLAALLLILTLGEAALTIRAQLADAPLWLQAAWWGLVGVVCSLFTWLIWRLLRAPGPTPDRPADDAAAGADADSVAAAMADAESLGADTSDVRRELDRLARRQAAGDIHVALFGEISTGKSALINALLPDAEARSDVRGGTTRDLVSYTWTSASGDRLIVTDMPGTAEADGVLDRLAEDEAQRAHIVVYVTDGDLNRAQHTALRALLAIRKPVILALNKSDRYSAAERAALSGRLRELLGDAPNAELVEVSAATQRQVVKVLPDGSERSESRSVAPRVDALALALQRQIDGRQEILDRLRDSATFVLARQQLDRAIAASRRQRADRLVDGYAGKAVVGALAAITPGSDLLIQGYLGTQLVRELAALYDTKVGKVDSELLLSLVQHHVGKAHTLLLAVAGNALKAFPGVGTLAGGALHAVAYGIIFRTLGRALTTTLETRGELHPRQTAKLFEETLGEDLETSARGIARLVAERARRAE